MDIIFLYIGAFLLGSIPTAYIVGKVVRGVDIRGYGSGNVGSANLYEHVGKKWAYPVAAVEIFIKGALPIWLALHVLDIDRASGYLVGPPLLAVTGNNWSIFLKLQGGRGIAVAGGTLVALSPVLAIFCAVIAIGGWKITKSSGLWVLISLILLPLWSYLIHDNLNLVWYCLGLLGLVSLKRISANWMPFPHGISRKAVLFNRLVRDRDVADRTGWVRRIPEGSS